MRPHRDDLERRTFWPRSSRPELLGEVDFDRPCPHCGYNLRGLAPGRACPECGAVEGLNIYAEPLAWEERRTVWSYLSVAFTVVFRPHELARHVWAPLRIDLESARRFRRVSLFLAAPALLAVTFVLTAAAVDLTRAAWCMIFNVAAIVIWLNAASLEPIVFFRDKLSGTLLKRTEAMAHYSSAALALAPPVQLALLLVTVPGAGSDPSAYVLAGAVHVGVLMAQLALGLMFIAWLMYETVNISAVGAFAFALAAATRTLGEAAVLLLGIPAMAGSIAARIGG